ncbi:MAG: hypothetical protein JXB10_09165 [Pirellulales bacterium]|nr:hypothetical protein [Pirellulales bacterium]
MRQSSTKTFLFLVVFSVGSLPLLAREMVVDFGYRPQQWRTAICPPDDTYKTLVNEKGALLYHYARGGWWFGTSVRVEVVPGEKIVDQQLLSPRTPIVQTRLTDGDLEILEEAFALKKQGTPPAPPKFTAVRKDRPNVMRNWAKLPAGVTEKLSAIAVGGNHPIIYQIKVPKGAAATVVLGLCESWHDRPGRRIMDLSVEGAPPKKVDTVADIGKNVADAFWFNAQDADHDGLIELKVTAAKDAQDKNAILNGFWVFDAPVGHDDAALLAGKLDAQAGLACYAGQRDNESRNDVILVHVANKGDAPKTVRPKVIVESLLNLKSLDKDRVRVDDHETVLATAKVASVTMRKNDQRGEAVLTLAPLTVEPGKTASFAAIYCGGGRIECRPLSTTEAEEERQAMVQFWKTVPLPYDRVTVPDENIQALFDSSIRNIWQAREIKNGLPAFQVGATCYRGLWIVDGAFILESATILGAGDQTRAGIAYMLSFQKPDGHFEILPRYWKENGIVLWTCTRFARLTQDKKWLESIWPKLEKVVASIKRLRDESYKDASPLNDGLMPQGGVDGGIGGDFQYEFSNAYWNLTGLKAAIQAARWLGKNGQADQWQKEYDDFYAVFRKYERRDRRFDVYGNRYLPILMAIEEPILLSENAQWYLPCKAQWAFCNAVYPGQLFNKNDPLVKGNLDMLKTYEKEGMVTTTGWLTHGIWNYFASFYGHALLWQGDGPKAAEVLYAYANHAAPNLAWIEEQGLKDQPIRENGDFPHNWASAEFIRLTTHLLALDRGRQMHLFEGLPRQWTGPGMVTRLKEISTPFGPLTCSLRVNDNGSAATFQAEPLSDPSCEKLVVHLGAWAESDPQATLELDPKKSHNITIPIKR